MDSSALRQELARLRSELDETRERLAAADRSAKERDDVLRTLSHDMRTPLSSLLLQAHMLQRTLAPDDPSRRRVEMILTNAQRVASMVGDLADIGLVENSAVRLERREVHLAGFFRELCDRLSGTLETGRVQVECAATLPPVFADPDRLERVFTNLVMNSIKYSAPGTPIVVTGAVEPGVVRVTVADVGVGIGPDELPHLFRRYFRTRHGQKTEGLGLGLYIAEVLVQAHGGTIEAESELGRGTRFHVRLPQAADASARGNGP